MLTVSTLCTCRRNGSAVTNESTPSMSWFTSSSLPTCTGIVSTTARIDVVDLQERLPDRVVHRLDADASADHLARFLDRRCGQAHDAERALLVLGAEHDERGTFEVGRRGEVGRRHPDERLAGLDHGVGLDVGPTRQQVDRVEALVGVVAPLIGDVHPCELDVLHPGQLIVSVPRPGSPLPSVPRRPEVVVVAARGRHRSRRRPRVRSMPGRSAGRIAQAGGVPKVPSSEASTVSTCWEPSTEPPSITRFWPVR